MAVWFLVFVPLAIGVEFLAPERHLLVFLFASLAILPLAAWMGRATEQLASRLGEGVGGLLNATFGNAAELIIALTALRAGLHDVVMASIVGSIVGNILLVLGAAMLAGGLRHNVQYYNPAGARSHSVMLTLAAIALVIPAAFHVASGKSGEGLITLSVSISVVLLIVYGLFLVFSLVTHASLFQGSSEENTEPLHEAEWSLRNSVLVLAGVTVMIAWISEIMVGAIEPAAHELGLSRVFVGVFIVAILGNAAEHSTAITSAMKNRMDLALAIAVGSSVQVALFVAPVLVIASLFMGPMPMPLVMSAGLVLMVLLSVLITGQVAGDGRSDWLRGVQLLAIYIVFAITYYFLPAVQSQ